MDLFEVAIGKMRTADMRIAQWVKCRFCGGHNPTITLILFTPCTIRGSAYPQFAFYQTSFRSDLDSTVVTQLTIVHICAMLLRVEYRQHLNNQCGQVIISLQ